MSMPESPSEWKQLAAEEKRLEEQAALDDANPTLYPRDFAAWLWDQTEDGPERPYAQSTVDLILNNLEHGDPRALDTPPHALAIFLLSSANPRTTQAIKDELVRRFIEDCVAPTPYSATALNIMSAPLGAMK
jgi:hypothetical protein